MNRPELKLESPAPNELNKLNALIIRSKAFWGYDRAFMQSCEAELKITEDLLAQNQIVTVTHAGTTVGVAEISTEADTAYLEKLFVDPDHMKLGAGRILFAWAKDTARRMDARKMIIESDPGAEAFYQKMGAKRVGQVPSGSVPGRLLPELEVSLV